MAIEPGRDHPPSSSVPVTPQQVLTSLMNDGTFDDLRHKIINQLKQNEDLKKFTTSKVEQSHVLNTPGAEHKSRRDLFEALRKELEGPVLERASKATWDLILSKDGIGQEISDTVYRAYNELSRKDSFLYSSQSPPHETRNQNHAGSHPKGNSQNMGHTHTTTPRRAEE